MSTTAWSQMEAQQAFASAARARLRCAIHSRLRRRGCKGLRVYDDAATRRSGADGRAAFRDIPLAAIDGTTEPNRTAQFDCGLRPAKSTRARWERVWLAEHRGVVLPPITVVRAGDTYAVRDGHHRVSVAKARGALTIGAIVDGG